MLQIELQNLSCASCVARAEDALKAAGGRSVRVSLADHIARVEGMSGQQAAAALSAAGYPPQTREITLAVPDMHCASCVARIEAAATGVAGVLDARADLAQRVLRVRTLGPLPAAFEPALAAMGYPVSRPGDTDAGEDLTPLLRRFILAACLTLPVFVVEMGGHAIPAFHHWIMAMLGAPLVQSAQMLLTALVLAGPGRGFFERGLPGLVRGRPDMDALVAVGAGAAFLYSCLVVLAPQVLPEASRQIYFEAAAVIVTLILLGRWLEARARGQAGDAVRRLLSLAPEEARVDVGGRFEIRPVSALRRGDLVELLPGGRIPVDGVVVEGESHVDESMLTGEPIPNVKTTDDPLAAGTLNGEGRLVMRATGVGHDTQLARIAALTQAAQATRLPVEALVNRIARVFVPAVMAVAALTLVIWLLVLGTDGLAQALVAAVSVLIIACPCAMGLATPMSIMVGTGRAAEEGVLFHQGDGLQHLAGADLIAFDKTGTLTKGQPALVDVQCAPGWERDAVLRLAATVEAGSEHPLARALLSAVSGERLPQAANFRARPGHGASADVDGRYVEVGNAHLLDGGDDPVAVPLAPDQTPVWLRVDGRIVARFALADDLRPDATRTIADLQAAGFQTALVSGDRADVAAHIGAALGIDRTMGGLRPEGKVDTLRDLQAAHGRVAFVGDGINDAPVLAAADIGMAVGTANDAAIAAADIVLLTPGLRPILRAVQISRATLRNIRQNLLWAFAYNVLLIPVAAGLLVPFGGPMLSPMLAAGAMALSSLMVVGNALRLKAV